jgi:hypothetical protein
VKVVDDCEVPDAGCASLAVDQTREAAFALRTGDGAFVMQREGAAAAEGAAKGPRFVVELPSLEIDSVCGCRMRARETIWGELSQEPPPTGCVALDAGSCLSRGEVDAGSAQDFLGGAGGQALDPNLFYTAVRGRIVDELEPVDETCACGTCRVEYEFHGRR